MSRCYSCYIESKSKEELKQETNDLIEEYTNDVTLYGGESDQEYSERIAKEMWTTEGKYFEMLIMMTYLEDLPYEEYEFDKEEYNEIMDIPEEDNDNV